MSERDSISDRIRRRICAAEAGAVFAPTDFLDLGTRAAVDQTLARLTKVGELVRLRRGVYAVPRVHERLGITLTPAPDTVAQALARGSGGTLQISGAQAANLLGLTEQVPARVVYLTDGRTGRVHVGGRTIELRHSAPRSMRAAGRVSGTVIQALRHLGKRNVGAEVIARLRRTLSEEDKRTLQSDLRLAPGWMQPVLAAVTAAADAADVSPRQA